MKKPSLFLRTAASLVLLLGAVSFACASDQTIRPTIDWALNHPEKMTPEVLKDPDNAALLNELRNHALSKPTMDAVVPLLNAGDSEVTRDCVLRFQSRSARYYPERALMRSNNPCIISLIGDNLDLNELSTGSELHGDLLVKPLSVSTAIIIKRIILQSSAFSPAVETWAKNLPSTLTDAEFRQQMKAWWNQNKILIKAKQYGEVQPPR